MFTTQFFFKVVFKWNNKTPVCVYNTGFLIRGRPVFFPACMLGEAKKSF